MFELTKQDGNGVWINSYKILSVTVNFKDGEQDGSLVMLSDRIYYYVKESPHQIINLMNGAAW